MNTDDKFDSVMAFFEKYEEPIKEAIPESPLGVIRELHDGLLEIMNRGVDNEIEAQDHIINSLYTLMNAYSTCMDYPDLHWL